MPKPKASEHQPKTGGTNRPKGEQKPKTSGMPMSGEMPMPSKKMPKMK